MNDFSTDVKLAQAGDSQAFSRLYALVYKDLYHIALYSLRNSHDACDAVSETVLDAFCSIGKLRDEKAFRSWIMKILSAKIKQKQREYFT
ncbi:MAG: sigma-70 family RNA polymerase sigma factor, partial [Ruminococcus sp.]|nr:sigma-70 family RNA polymerase sigma factor [Ruminococcus sp.]